MGYEKLKSALSFIILFCALAFSYTQQSTLRAVFSSVLSISLLIMAASYRRNTKETNMIVKSFITVFWWAAAAYSFYLTAHSLIT